MQGRNRQRTLKQHITLCLGAAFLALLVQISLSFYQSSIVLGEMDRQMGNFNAISSFQSGVEASLTALESYRWEFGDEDVLLEQLHAAATTTNAWLWRIDGDLDTTSEEQNLLYQAVCTTYDRYMALLEQLEAQVAVGADEAASQLYYTHLSLCGGYLRQYTQQLLNIAILDAKSGYTTLSTQNDRIRLLQTVVTGLCILFCCVAVREVLRMLTPVQQMIGASREISRGAFDTPDIPVPRQAEMGQLAEAFNRMKRSMAQQVSTLQEKNEIERELHRQQTEALELQNRMEHSRLQQLRSQIDPHFLFNTLNVILQTAGQEAAYRTQALIAALSHLLRYSLMSNDEQVPLAREVRIVDEYYSIYHVRFGERIQMEWRISDSLDLTETMVPSFILQPIVENAFKHGISPREEGGRVRIRINPLRERGLLYISVCDNGVGISPERLAQLRGALEYLAAHGAAGERWEHIGVYNVAARLRLLDTRARLLVRSRPGRGTAVVLYLPLKEQTEEENEDDPIADRG
ncbi:MAG: histidine kinase [Faecalibacterium sp.]